MQVSHYMALTGCLLGRLGNRACQFMKKIDCNVGLAKMYLCTGAGGSSLHGMGDLHNVIFGQGLKVLTS